MPEKEVIYEKERSIAKIIINRPDKHNALTWDMLASIVNLVHKAEDDDDIKVIIIKGNGPSFCSGFDLSLPGFVYGMKEPKPGEPLREKPPQRIRLKFDRWLLDQFRQILYCWKPTIAQVHGYCIGGGRYLMEVCDISIASNDASIGFGEQRLGFAGATFTLPLEILLVGFKRARELLITGKFISGEEAAEIGLVNRAVPRDVLEEEVMSLAEEISLMPRDGIFIGKAYTFLVYDMFGLNSMFNDAFVLHTLFTNIKWSEDELNFFKERRDRKVSGAIKAMLERWTKVENKWKEIKTRKLEKVKRGL